MSFGGTTEPCAMIDVLSAGKISKEENMKYTKALTELMAKINVPQNRFVNLVSIWVIYSHSLPLS